MDITPLVGADKQIIQSYSAGRFKVSGAVYEGAVFVFPDETLKWDIDISAGDLTSPDLQPLIDRASDIDVVLLGCGGKMEDLRTLKEDLRTHDLVADVMDSGAACRTYNVLMAEGRRVVAAMLPV